MNFNFSQRPDYTLNSRLIEEMIRLYGTKVKFVMMDKIQDKGDFGDLNSEASIFNDFKALKSREGIEREIWVLLETTEGFPNGMNFMFGQFGLHNEDTLQVQVALSSFDFLAVDDFMENLIDQDSSSYKDSLYNEMDKPRNVHPRHIIGNILIFPNGKTMEITDCQLHVEGVNNTFVYSDRASSYLLSLKSHNFDRSAVSNAIVDQGTLKTKINPKVDEFFEKQDIMQELIKEEATKEVLVTKCLEEVPVKGAQIDDVFGTN